MLDCRPIISDDGATLGNVESIGRAARSRNAGCSIGTSYGTCLPTKSGAYTSGTTNPQLVTPTPFAPEETVSWLALPSPRSPRPYVLLLKPEEIPDIWGPRWVRFGGGIEYHLPNGFPPTALAFTWELEVR